MVSIALSMPLTAPIMFTRHLSHRHGRLDPARYRINAAREAEQVERLALLSDCVRGVYPRAIIVTLLQRLRPNKLRIQLCVGRSKYIHTFFSRVFSTFSSFCAFFAWRLSDFAVNCGDNQLGF
jgi:hypothetical protein